MMYKYFISIMHVIVWVLNIRPMWWMVYIRLWQMLLFIGLATGGGLLWFTYHSPGGEATKPESDTHIDGGVIFDNKLDVFRSKWDIYGRFESWPALLPLAEMSKAAYGSEIDANEVFKRYGFSLIVSLESKFHSQYAYVVHGDDVLIVVFRGTDDTEDWFSDVNAYPRKMPEGDLHTGFANAYGMLQSQIWQEIEKTKPKHIWITGHSLGGAMALVCAYDLSVYRGCNIDGVITFGQPMIGKHNLANSLQNILGDRYVHFVNEKDGVPQVPLGFAHCGLLLWFKNGEVQKSSNYIRPMAKSREYGSEKFDGQYVPIDQLPEMEQKQFEEFKRNYRQKKQIVQPLMTSSPMTYERTLPLIDDHSMDLYVEKIHDAIKNATN